MATEHLKLTKREALSRPLDISEFDGNLDKIDAAFETAPKGEDGNIDFTLLLSGAQSSTTVTSTVTEQKLKSELKLSASENNILQVKEDGLFVSASGGGTPEGGTTGQLLAKKSDTNYDAWWVDSHEKFGLGGKAKRVSGDWNEVVLGGWYDGQSLTNSPIDGWVNVLVCPSADTSKYVTQIAFEMSGQRRWVRNKIEAVWGGWSDFSNNSLINGNNSLTLSEGLRPYGSLVYNAEGEAAMAYHVSGNSQWVIGTGMGDGALPGFNFIYTGTLNSGGYKMIISTTGEVSANDFIVTSDERKKKDITSFGAEALDKALKVESVSFRWRDTEKQTFGVIAQQVEELLPEVVHTDEEGYKSVSYSALHSIQIQALIEQNNALKNRLDTIEQKLKPSCQ